MTPARKAALQWFHDNPESSLVGGPDPAEKPSVHVAIRMAADGELALANEPEWWPDNYKEMVRLYPCSLTDLGRRRLNGDDI